MSKVRIYKVESRLSKLVRKPGGRTFAEALRSAEARVDAVRDSAARRLAEIAGELRELAQRGRARDFAALDALYGKANDIFALAGYAQMTALSQAAFSLCDLLTAADVGADVDWAAVEVHIDAIRLLCNPVEPACAGELLAGLKGVRAKFTQAKA